MHGASRPNERIKPQAPIHTLRACGCTVQYSQTEIATDGSGPVLSHGGGDAGRGGRRGGGDEELNASTCTLDATGRLLQIVSILDFLTRSSRYFDVKDSNLCAQKGIYSQSLIFNSIRRKKK